MGDLDSSIGWAFADEDETTSPVLSTLDRILNGVRDVITTGGDIYREITLAPVQAQIEAAKLQSAASLTQSKAPGNVGDWAKLLLYVGLGVGAVALGLLVFKRAT